MLGLCIQYIPPTLASQVVTTRVLEIHMHPPECLPHACVSLAGTVQRWELVKMNRQSCQKVAKCSLEVYEDCIREVIHPSLNAKMHAVLRPRAQPSHQSNVPLVGYCMWSQTFCLISIQYTVSDPGRWIVNPAQPLQFILSHRCIMFLAPVVWVPLESTNLQQHASINLALVYACNFIYVYGFSGVQ